MGVTYARSGCVFTITCDGTYAADDMIAAFDGVLALDDFPSDALLVLDMRSSESVLDRPVADMRRVVRHYTERAERFQRRLAIVTDAGVRYGLMRMASTWAELDGAAVHVCLDHDEALRWLLAPESSSG